jgi:hypothetical protein
MASKREEDNSQSSTPSDISRAISVFVHRYCFTRSMTHPYIAEEVGSLWVMRDAPRRSGNYRTEEWIAHNLAPEEINCIVQKHKRDPYTISYICGKGESPDPRCADMFVIPEFRRCGIVRAMLIRMLTDDLKGGAVYTVMLAGHTGAMLYPVVGYEQIGTLLLFNPPKIGHEQVI